MAVFHLQPRLGQNTRRIGIALVTVTLMILGFSAHALDPSKALTQYGYGLWTAADGLPQNSVRTLLQGKNGYLWLGTYEGLTLFDGVRMRPFIPARPEDPMPSRNISKLVLAADGAIWVATTGNGLFRVAPDWTTRQWTIEDGLYSNQINDLFLTSDGDLLLAGQGGVNRIHQNAVQNVLGADGTDDPVQSVFVDAGGTLWLGFRGQGLRAWRQGKAVDYPGLDKLSKNRVEDIIGDGGQGLWVALLEGGLAHVTPTAVEITRTGGGLISDDVLRLYLDHHGALWIGTYGFGLQRLYKGRFSSFDKGHGLSNPYILSLFIDREGTLWFGSSGGLNRLVDGKFRNWSTSEGLAGNYARSVVEGAHGTIWVGLDGGGLTPIRNGQLGKRLTRDDGLLSNRARAIWPNADGSVWVAAYNGGVNRVQDDRVVATYGIADGLPSERVRTLYGGHDGALWIGAETGGVTRLLKGRFEHYRTDDNDSANDIRAYIEYRGKLWVGTYGAGIFVFDGRQLVARYNRAQGLPSGVVFTFYVDMYQHLWVGTDGGVARLLRNRFEKVTPAPTSGAVFQILGDDRHRLWLCTNAGVLRFTPRDQQLHQAGPIPASDLVRYGHDDGMRAAQCNGATQPAAWRVHDGTLWFPTIDGITSIDPANIPSNPVIPLLQIERLLVDRQPIPWRNAGAVQLPPGRHDIQIDYTGLSLVAPRKNRFQIRLLGLQEPWQPVGNRRSAFFTQLGHGHYRFELRGANNDGVWNPDTVSMEFTIRPYFSETLVFRVFTALSMLGLAFAAYRWRVTRLHRAKAVLEQRVHQRTRQLEAKAREAAHATRAKSDFLSHMSHEIRTPLTAIIGFTEHVLETADPEAAQQLQIVLHNARHLNLLVNDILDLSKIEAGKMEIRSEPIALPPLLAEMQSINSSLAAAKGLSFELQAELPIPEIIHTDPMRLKQVLLNLLGNAIKFTHEGTVRLQLAWDQSAGKILFHIIDTGIGIPRDKQHLLFQNFSQADASVTRRYGGTGLGLVISQHLARAMSGDIEVHSESGAGSTFTLSLPVPEVADMRLIEHPSQLLCKDSTTSTTRATPELHGKILLAEDDLTNQTLIEMMLQDTALSIDMVEDGEAAIQAVSRGAYDLILMDMHMPRMGGVEATRRIRKENPTIPIIALTADVMPQQVAEHRRAGCNATVAKPIDRNALLDVLQSHLSGRLE